MKTFDSIVYIPWRRSLESQHGHVVNLSFQTFQDSNSQNSYRIPCYLHGKTELNAHFIKSFGKYHFFLFQAMDTCDNLYIPLENIFTHRQNEF